MTRAWTPITPYGSCGRVSRLGPQLAGIVCFGSCLTDLFNLTSERDTSHMCLISLSSRHVYHYYTCSSGRGVPCTQVLATKPCGCQANIGYNASPWLEVKIPKADNTWDGHCPQKRLLMWEGFSSRPPISKYCSLWLMPHGFVQSHIGERRLSHVPYNLELKMLPDDS